MNKTFKLLISQLKTKDITVVQDVEEITIRGFERELLQVFLNIINNARDALEMIEGKRYIFVEIYKEENSAVIKIKDNAQGINQDIIKRVFEPYFTTKHKSQGTGIGLYMSQEIVARHMNGTIEVDNETYEYEGETYKGACFKVSLPCTI